MTAAVQSLVLSARRTSALPFLRRRKPLTRRELEAAYAKIKARILKGGEPFGVFVLKHGRSRRVTLIAVNHASYDRNLRAEGPQQHYIATYDRDAELMAVWEHLCAFDRVQRA